MAGLDALIQNRMAVGRQNPQALAQSYQQNQSILDLLALQKLKSEKEAAARELAMQSGANGGMPTVAQQREQELLEMSKAEIAQQVTAAEKQKQLEQQKRMQALMNAGIGGLPTRAFRGGGGITAFSGGGDVERPDDEILGYDDYGNPLWASDFARAMNAGAVDDTPEGEARRAQYAALRERGQQGRADILGAARKPIEITPPVDEGIAALQPYRSGNVGLDELVQNSGVVDFVKDKGGDLLNWAKENPYDAASYAMMAIPGMGLAGGAVTKALPWLYRMAKARPLLTMGATGAGMQAVPRLGDEVLPEAGTDEAPSDNGGISALAPRQPGRDSSFRMQGVGTPAPRDSAATVEATPRTTPQPSPTEMGPNATPIDWLMSQQGATTAAEPKSEYEQLLERRAAIMNQQADPKRQAMDRLIAGLIAAGGRTSAASALQGIGEGISQERTAQEEQALKQIQDLVAPIEEQQRRRELVDEQQAFEAEQNRLDRVQREDLAQLEATLTREGLAVEQAAAEARSVAAMIEAYARGSAIPPANLMRLYSDTREQAAMRNDPNPDATAEAAVQRAVEVIGRLGGAPIITSIKPAD